METENEKVLTLIKALSNEKDDVSLDALYELGEMGPLAKTAVPALVNALGNKNADIRINAVFALIEIGPDAKEAIPALIKAFDDNDGEVALTASEALVRIGKEAVPALIDALKTGSPDARVFAANTLGVIGSEAIDAVPTLVEVFKGKYAVEELKKKGITEFAAIIINAADAIRKIDPTSKEVIPASEIEALKERYAGEVLYLRERNNGE